MPAEISAIDILTGLVYDKADAEWFASIGLNLIRVAVNYRHLNDDMDPASIKEEGFKLIDRVVNLVRLLQHRVASQLMLRTLLLVSTPSLTCTRLPAVKTSIGTRMFRYLTRGSSLTTSDNNLPEALLWEYKDFQDRTVRIWEAIAERYRGFVSLSKHEFWLIRQQSMGRGLQLAQ